MRIALALLVVGLLTCKKPAPPPAPVDAGTTITTASAAAAVPPPPLATDTFEIVAKGKASSKVLSLQAHGTRVWLSARNLDAFADGDGPLVKGPDPLEKLAYTPGKHYLQVVGVEPHLFVMRTNVTAARGQPQIRPCSSRTERPGRRQSRSSTDFTRMPSWPIGTARSSSS